MHTNQSNRVVPPAAPRRSITHSGRIFFFAQDLAFSQPMMTQNTGSERFSKQSRHSHYRKRLHGKQQTGACL